MSILIFLKFSISSFNDFYPNLTPNKTIEGITVSRTHHNILYHFNCEFININGVSALYYSTIQYIVLLIEQCSFCNCSTYQSGGGIFFSCEVRGECTISKTCGYRCYTESSEDGQFSYLIIPDEANLNINFTSLYMCSPMVDATARKSSLYLFNGIIKISNLNSSYNTLHSMSSISFNSFIVIELNFSTFLSNIVSDKHSLYFFSSPGSTNKIINLCNIIQCNGGLTGGSVIFSQVSQLFVIKCIFLENSENLFGTSVGGSIFVQYCWIQHPLDKLTSRPNTLATFFSFLDNNNSLDSTKIYSYNYYKSLNCYPLEINYLLDISPCQTIPINCSCFLQNQLSYSFISILSFYLFLI